MVQWLKAPSVKPDWRALSLSFSFTSCVPQFLCLMGIIIVPNFQGGYKDK